MKTAVSPRPADLSKTYYHGTPDTQRARSILQTGLVPQLIERPRTQMAPVQGRVYLTPDLGYALVYALGGDVAGTDYQPRDTADPYGYVFVVPGSDLQDIQPDEDSVGEMASFVLRSKPELFFRNGVIPKWCYWCHNSPEGEKALAIIHPSFASYVVKGLTPNQKRKVAEGEYAYFASTGKKLVKVLPPWLLLNLIDAGAHIAHGGEIRPTEVWRVDKRKASLFDKSGSNFFEVAEKWNGQTSKTAAADQATPKSKWETVQANEPVTVYHGTGFRGFAEMANGIDAMQLHGRIYGGPAGRGLFVTSDLDVADRFGYSSGGAGNYVVMVIRTRAKFLHGTDWDGNISGAKEDGIWKDKYPNSFRPSLSESLLRTSMEPQAILLGYVKPADIVSVLVGGEEKTREEAIQIVAAKLQGTRHHAPKNYGVDLTSPKLTPEAFAKAVSRGSHSPEAVLSEMHEWLDRYGKERFTDKLQDPDFYGVALGEKAAQSVVRGLEQVRRVASRFLGKEPMVPL